MRREKLCLLVGVPILAIGLLSMPILGYKAKAAEKPGEEQSSMEI